jgi:F-type H+-transporting ATPase subunit gamma
VSDTVASLRRKIASAGELGSVVRTMKAMAASSIGQYENAVRSLDNYYRTVQLGLVACFRQAEMSDSAPQMSAQKTDAIGAIVFGSDQGLVGRFNEIIVEYVVQTLSDMPGEKTIWAVGERIQSRLQDKELQAVEAFSLPSSINAITPLVWQILMEMERLRERGDIEHIYLFHNRPKTGAIYAPVGIRLLPLDDQWRHDLVNLPWPTNNLPEVMNSGEQTLRALIREYFFVSLFRACAESLASENASRLAAMQRAETNIDELQTELKRTFQRLRQSDIDEELFDVVAGFEALTLDV